MKQRCAPEAVRLQQLTQNGCGLFRRGAAGMDAGGSVARMLRRGCGGGSPCVCDGIETDINKRKESTRVSNLSRPTRPDASLRHDLSPAHRIHHQTQQPLHLDTSQRPFYTTAVNTGFLM